jgi:phosphoglycerol transferase MdoB-like AlkP superfamily enzyme
MGASRIDRYLQTRFGSLYVFGAVYLAISFALRVALAIREGSRLGPDIVPIGEAFLVGAVFDLLTYFYIAAPAALFLLLAPDRLFRWRWHRVAAYALYFAVLFAILFDTAAEWLFWAEFGTRFNFMVVDYLVYTKEVAGNIRESYPLPVILGGLAAGAAIIFLLTWRRFGMAFQSTSTLRQRLAPAGVHLAVVLVASLLPSFHLTDIISKNYYVGGLAGNGLYSLAVAFQENTLRYDQFYRTENDATAFRQVREWVKADNAKFVGDDPLSLARQITASGPENRWNVVIVMVESLSLAYLEAGGDTEGLTPNLNALAKESLFCSHLYATGTRTDRGLEAVTLSLPPTPGQSLVKRPHNDRLFSIGPIFRSRGYETKFIYSGYAYFDNMATFFSGNGFDIVDRGSFAKDEISFATIWGVCDEDLFARAIKECDASAAAGRPFCSIVLTTSNHRPFAYPGGKIDIPSGTGPRGAVKYTDYAIGQFMAQARRRPWFANTVFVIVADHCASSAGNTAVPVEKYRIPLIYYAPGLIPPKTIDRMASQIDVSPTLLGLLHFSYTSRFYGMDLQRPGPERALLGNYEKVGLFVPGRLSLLLPRRQAEVYGVDDSGSEVLQSEDAKAVQEAVSFYQSASYLLDHGLYKGD